MAHGGVLGPLRSGSLHHAVSFPFRGFDTKFEPSILKNFGFFGVGLCGTLMGLWGLNEKRFCIHFSYSTLFSHIEED